MRPDDLALGGGAITQGLLVVEHPADELVVPGGKHAHREQTGVLRIADADRGHRHPTGHLDDGQQRVHSVQVGQRHRHPDHRQRGEGGHHAGQMGSATGTSDDDLDATSVGGTPEPHHLLGHAMGRDDVGLVGHAELVEHLGGGLHRRPVGVRPHDDGHSCTGLLGSTRALRGQWRGVGWNGVVRHCGLPSDIQRHAAHGARPRPRRPPHR